MRYTSLIFISASLIACSFQPNPTSEVVTSIAIDQDESVNPHYLKIPSENNLFLHFPSGIRCIFEDSKGNTWFGSHQEGVCLFDGSKLTYFTSEDGLSNNQVRSIFEDENGIIWFETGGEMSGYSGNNFFIPKDFIYDQKDEWKVSPKDIWFKENGRNGFNHLEGEYGTYRYDGSRFYFHAFPLKTKEIGQTYSVSAPYVKSLDGTVWIGTYSAVFGFNGSQFTILDNESLGLDDQTGHLHVRSLFEDSQGTLWIGNNGIGVYRQDQTGFKNFSEEQGLISEKSGRSGGFHSPPGSLEHVFAISEDHAGNIWFGDRDTGAWKYDGTSMKNYNEEIGLTDPFIWQIYPTKNGELWFAMGNGFVMKFNDGSFERVF